MFPISRVKPIQTLTWAGMLCLLITTGCSEPASTTQKTLTAIADYESRLQNLAPYTIESCEITITSHNPGGVPIGPSSTTTILAGYAVLGPDSLSRIQDDFEWQPVDNATVPIELVHLFPAGITLLGSHSLEKTFSENWPYCQGNVFLELHEDRGVLYIYADHCDG